MFEIYILLYVMLLAIFVYRHATGMNKDHVFAPWPGYPVIFATYFLLGTLSLTTPVTDTQWLVYSLAIGGFWLGSFLTRATWRPFATENRPSLDDQKDYFVSSLNVPLVFLASMFGLVLTLYLWQGSGIPLLSQNVDSARTSMVSNGYVAQLATTLDVAAIFALAYLLARWGKKRSADFWVCVIVVAVFIAVALLSGSRSRFLKLAIPAVVLFHFIVRPIRLKGVLMLALGGLFFVGALGYFRWYAMWGELNRAEGPTFEAIFSYATYELSTAAYGLDIVLKYFPSLKEHTAGYLHLGPFTTPFGSGIPTPGDYFKSMIGGRWAGFGLAATFLAPMYADFSYIGVVVMSALYCSFLLIVYRAAQQPKITRIYKLCIYAIVFFFVASGIRSDWLSFEFIWFVAIGWGFYLMRRPAKQQGPRHLPRSVSPSYEPRPS